MAGASCRILNDTREHLAPHPITATPAMCQSCLHTNGGTPLCWGGASVPVSCFSCAWLENVSVCISTCKITDVQLMTNAPAGFPHR